MSFSSDPLQALGRIFASTLGRDSWLINTLRPFYEAALVRYHGDRGIPWTINGVPFRIDAMHRQLMGKNWDPDVAAFLSERVQPGSLCLDVGANAGVYVLQFCHWTAPSGKVIAFEPNPITRGVLQTHVRMNGLEKHVEVAPYAVYDREEDAEFHFAGASGMSRLGQANAVLAATAQAIIVPTTTLDSFCALRSLRPDWLIIDIEGYELQALRGARDLIARCPALQIIVEIHPNLWPLGQVSASLESFLRENRLTAQPLSGQTNPFGEHGSISLSRQS